MYNQKSIKNDLLNQNIIIFGGNKMKKLTLILSMLFCTALTFSQDSNQIKPITIEENTLESVVPIEQVEDSNTTVNNAPKFTGSIEPLKSGLPHIFYTPSGWFFISRTYFDNNHSMVESGIYKDDQVPVLRNEDNHWSEDKEGKIDVSIGQMQKVTILEDEFYGGKGERSKYSPNVSFPWCIQIAPGKNIPTFSIQEGIPTLVPYVPNEDRTGFNYYFPSTVFEKEVKDAIKKALEDLEK